MTPEQIRKVLADIHSRVPEILRKNVVSYQKVSPHIEMVMGKALEDESIPQEKRDHIRTLLDAGEFSKIKVIENPKIIEQIDKFVSREINKAVKEGRLPKKRALIKIMKDSVAKQDEQRRNTQVSEGEDTGK